MNPFDYVNAINTSKQNLMRGTDNDKLAEKSYNTFLTNRAMSYHMDTIGVANEMNQRYEADNLLQFEYFLNTVRPKKRFAKWVKKDDEGDLSVVGWSVWLSGVSRSPQSCGPRRWAFTPGPL